MQKGEPLESIVAVKIMTAKVKTDEEKELVELISQYRKEKAEILKLVDKTINELICDNKYNKKIMINHWLLSNIINPVEIKLVEEDWEIVEGHSLANTSLKFFDEYGNELNKRIINMLENPFMGRELSLAKIGKLCIILETVNPNFNCYEKNMGIKLQLPKVKKVLRLFKKNYFKIVDGKNFSEEKFIEMLIELEEKGE